MRKLLLIPFLAWCMGTVHAQLVVSDTLTPIQMVEALEGPGVHFSNIQVNCPGGDGLPQMAQFDGTNTNLGVATGLIMSSGAADSTLGSNDDNISQWFSLNAGDADLDQIVTPDNTNDACVIEFDLQMTGDTLRFNYVFASEEYPEFVNSFNDVFAFFISGPGINGTFSNSAINIAVLPGTNVPVTINNINNGDNDCFLGGPNGPCMNCTYYVDNCGGNTVEYDGFTTKLTAIIPVEPCATYHLKLAIADVIDGALDSGVFLENESFASSQVNFSTAFADVFEGCTKGGIDFVRKDPNSTDSVFIYFDFGGTALNGVDYGVLGSDGTISPFPDDLTILPGEDSITLTIQGIGDDGNEENEEIVIYVLIDDCIEGRIPIDSITLTLHDFIYVELLTDTLVCPGQEVKFSVRYDADTARVTSTTLSYDPEFTWRDLHAGALHNTVDGVYEQDTLLVFSAFEDASFVLSITDSFNCFGADTVFYDVLEPELTDFTYFYSNPSDPNVIQFVNLSQFPDNTVYRWEFGDNSGTVSLADEPLYVFPDTGTYMVMLSASGPGITDCPYFKEVIVKPLSIPNVITPNGDDINDTFEAFGMFDYHLTVFNRWGKKVFEDPNYKNTFQGDDLSDGTYYYYILYPETGFEFKGWFQIMR